MKPGIHPKVHTIKIRCACGQEFETLSVKEEMRVDICSACHPFFTGHQKFVDTEGRIDKFQKKFGRDAATAVRERHSKKGKKAEEAAPAAKVESIQAD